MRRQDYPRCPRHRSSRVRRDGTYGVKDRRAGYFRRQRYECVRANGDVHKFIERMPRRVVPAGTECDHCEQPILPWAGGRCGRHEQFTSTEIALALYSLGKGDTYRAAARSARNSVGRKRKAGLLPSAEGHLVEDWLEVYAPAIITKRREHETLEVLVLDSRPFSTRRVRPAGSPRGPWITRTPRHDRKPSTAWSLLCAMNYTQGKGNEGPKGTIVALAAVSGGATADDWERVFKQLSGAPKRIVADAGRDIRTAIRRHWGVAMEPIGSNPKGPQFWACEYHLRTRLDALFTPGDPLRAQVDAAWEDLEHWQAFAEQLRRLPVPMYKRVHAWLHAYEPFVIAQLGNRLHPYSTGAVEKGLADVGGQFRDRAGLFRNRRRMDLLLGLLLLERLGRADHTEYMRIIQRQLRTHQGSAPRQRRRLVDPITKPTLFG